MSDLAPKLKKHLLKRGSLNGDRRRSSVAQIETVVSKIMEAEAGGEFLLPEIGETEKVLTDDKPNEKDKAERRLKVKTM